MAAFNHIAVTRVVKTAVNGRIQLRRHHLGRVAFRQQDIAWVIISRSGSFDLNQILEVRLERCVEGCQPVRQHRRLERPPMLAFVDPFLSAMIFSSVWQPLAGKSLFSALLPAR
jgi:hypothetical protein